MEEIKKKIVIIFILVANLAAVCPAGSKERIVHFPKDRSLGILKVQDENFSEKIDTFPHYSSMMSWYGKAEYLCQAQGDVIVPAGKRLGLFIHNPAIWRDLSPLTELRPDDIYILIIDNSLQNPQKPDDNCINYISYLSGLKILSLNGTRITNKGIKHISKMQSLERLLLESRIQSSGLMSIAQLKSLKGLYLHGDNVTDVGLRHLTNIPSLEELWLWGEKHIGDGGLVYLKQLPSLRYLVLVEGNFSDEGMAHLKHIPSLKVLRVGPQEGITNKALKYISEIRQLEQLWMPGVGMITDKGLSYLKEMPNLKRFDVSSNTKITDTGLAYLAEMKTFENLSLPGQYVSDEGLSHLSKLSNLKVLIITRTCYVDPNMDKNYYTDKGLEELTKIRSLETLHIGSLGFTDEGIIKNITKFNKLKDLHLFCCPNVTDKSLSALAEVKTLERLHLSRLSLTIAGLSNLNSLTNLRWLRIDNIKQDNSTLDISGLTKLEKLGLSLRQRRVKKKLISDKGRDEDLACLANLKKLRWFQGYNGMSNKGLSYLQNLTNMDRLGISGHDINDDGLMYLANMRKLDALRIYGGKYTDKGLQYLQGLKSLSILEIEGENDFSQQALARLRWELPNLAIFRIEDKHPAGKNQSKPAKNKKPKVLSLIIRDKNK